ncbi:MAG: flagellar basal body M-ring protein FliF, partial [Thalassolituus sp.]
MENVPVQAGAGAGGAEPQGQQTSDNPLTESNDDIRTGHPLLAGFSSLPMTRQVMTIGGIALVIAIA